MCHLKCSLWSSRLPLTPIIVSFSGSWMNEKRSFNEMKNGHSSKFFSIQCISFIFLVCDPVVFLGSVDTQWDPAVAELLPKKGGQTASYYSQTDPRWPTTSKSSIASSILLLTSNLMKLQPWFWEQGKAFFTFSISACTCSTQGKGSRSPTSTALESSVPWWCKYRQCQYQ